MKEFQDVQTSTIYIVACSTITFLATLLAVAAHVIPVTASLFVGTVVEGVFTIILVIFWSAIVALRSDASLGLVGIEDATQTVQNANLYYFSWAGFITSILLLVNYVKCVYGFDTVSAIRGRSARTDIWTGILGTSIVIFGACVRTLKNDCTAENANGYPDGYCPRTNYGISVGVFGVITSIVVLYFKIKGMGFTLFVEGCAGLFMAVLNTFAVFLLTAAAGPGSAIGNIYYFSWASSLLCWYLVFSCYGEYSGHDSSAETTVPTDPNTLEQPNVDEFDIGTLDEEKK
jgi:hypothetical protein